MKEMMSYRQLQSLQATNHTSNDHNRNINNQARHEQTKETREKEMQNYGQKLNRT